MNKIKKSTPADKMAKSLMDDLKGAQNYGLKRPVRKSEDDHYAKMLNADHGLESLQEKNELEDLLKAGSPQVDANLSKTKTGQKNFLKDNIMLTDQAQTASLARPESQISLQRGNSESEKTMLLSEAENRPANIAQSQRMQPINSIVSKVQSPASSYASNHELTVSGKKNLYQATMSLPARTLPASEAVEPEIKVTYGMPKTQLRNQSNDTLSSVQSQLMQAETLKIAQVRIIDLEKEVDKLRRENDGLLSAGDINNKRNEEYIQRIQSLERSKFDAVDQAQQEVRLYKENLLSKDQEIIRLRNKIDEINQRLNADMKKVRVRERELENRLELSKMEKIALVRTKDESILELKRKIDLMSVELDNYKTKCIELNQQIESNQEQFSRTVRALRLALTNLEANEHTLSITLAPLKKAE